MGILELIENSALATFVRESPSLFGYTAVLSLHAIGLAVLVGVNSVVAMRLLGVAPGIRIGPLLKFFPLMYTGFFVNALSGLALLAASATTMLANPMFYIKLGFIGIAVAVLYFIRHRVFADPASLDLPAGVTATARKLAWASLACWGAALVAGRLTAYPYFVNSLLGLS